ncbi:MAG: ion channel [Pseudomonadota bacterium]
MALQVVVGVTVISLTAYIHATTLALALHRFEPLRAWALAWPSTLRTATLLAASVLWVMAAHLIEVALWAAVLILLGVFSDLERAVYFSLVAYTTLGFGDIILPEDWRILSGLIAANGFLVFGWSTAFQVDLLADLRRDQS